MNLVDKALELCAYDEQEWFEFKELDIDSTSVIRMSLIQAVEYNGIPFEVKKVNKKMMSEDEFLERLALSRTQSREGKVIDADVAINSIKEKYGL